MHRPLSRGASKARERARRLEVYNAKRAEMQAYVEAYRLASGEGRAGEGRLDAGKHHAALHALSGETISDASHWSPASAALLAEWEVLRTAGIISESTLAARVRRQALIEVCDAPSRAAPVSCTASLPRGTCIQHCLTPARHMSPALPHSRARCLTLLVLCRLFALMQTAGCVGEGPW